MQDSEPPEPPARPTLSAFDAGTDRFDVGIELGRGGMGRVFTATDRGLDRVVAIKQAHGARTEDVMRFEREVRITARLEHPSIVPIYEAGRDSRGRPYYVMRRIEGEPLADRVARAGSVQERLGLIPNMCAAVDAAAFAHARKVIHRDIKPWNILLGAYGETLLIDWGLAREMGETDAAIPPSRPPDANAAPQLTRVGIAYGTPGYMSPEQARGESVDMRADVYALGATLFHVLVGATPFDGISETEWMARASAGLPPPLERIPEEVPAELVAIVTKAMAVKAADRYADAGELAMDLRRFLMGQLVGAHRYTTRERIVRFARRYRIAVAVIAIALTAIAVIGTFAIARTLRERDRADVARRDAEQQRYEAVDRAEISLLDRATTLLEQDPTRAAALLLNISPSSPHQLRARDIAAAAAANGIAHGVHTHAFPIHALVISDDGRSLLATGSNTRGGRLEIHDMITAKTRTLVDDEPVSQAVWANGGKTIVYGVATGGLYAVDVATRDRRLLVADAFPWGLWVVGDDRVRVLESRSRRLLEVSLGGGAVKVLAEGVAAAAATGERLFVVGRGVRVIDPDGQRVLDTGEATTFVAAISASGSRGAFSTISEVIEWDLDRGVELRRWPQLFPRTTRYVGERLFASSLTPSGRGRLLELPTGGEARDVISGEWSEAFMTSAFDGQIAFASAVGDIVIARGGATYPIALRHEGIRHIAGHPKSPFVAVGATDGTIMWWDVREISPALYEVPTKSNLCGFDEAAIYLLDDFALWRLDRDTRKLVAVVNVPVVRCMQGPDGFVLIVNASGQITGVVDMKTGTARYNDEHMVIDHPKSRLVMLKDQGVYVVTPGESTAHHVWEAPSEIYAVAAGRERIAVTLEHLYVRIDAGGQVSTILRPPNSDEAVVTATGDIWVHSGDDMMRWTGLYWQRHPIGGTPARYGPCGERGITVVRDDGSLWYLEGDRAVQRGGPTSTHGAMIGERASVRVELGRRVVATFVDTGVEISKEAPSIVSGGVQVGLKDRGIGIRYSGEPGAVAIFANPVPADPAKYRAWVESATNARVDRNTDALTWR